MPGPDWLYFATAGLLAAIGLPLLCWSLFHDRAKGRRRCPKCWYDMTGVPGLTCPECGHVAKSEPKLSNTRRRWRLAAFGVIAILLATIGWQMPQMRRHGFWSIIPTTMVLGLDSVFGYHFPGLAEETSSRFETRYNELWDWQRRELLERKFRYLVPQRWLRGEELRVRPLGWFEELPIDHPGHRLFLSYENAVESEYRGLRDDLSYERTWTDGTVLLEKSADAELVQLVARVTDVSAQVHWQTSLQLGVLRRSSVDQLLEPVRNPAIDGAIRKELHARVIFLPTSKRPCVVVNTVTDPQCNGLTVGLVIEVRHGNLPVAKARAWLRCNPFYPTRVLDPILLVGLPEALAEADPNDFSWTVRIRGDGEMALRDLSATKYWSGEFTLPLKDVLK